LHDHLHKAALLLCPLFLWPERFGNRHHFAGQEFLANRVLVEG
jgi:hypothetical protein